MKHRAAAISIATNTTPLANMIAVSRPLPPSTSSRRSRRRRQEPQKAYAGEHEQVAGDDQLRAISLVVSRTR